LLPDLFLLPAPDSFADSFSAIVCAVRFIPAPGCGR
jgi:hypothetical protein